MGINWAEFHATQARMQDAREQSRRGPVNIDTAGTCPDCGSIVRLVEVLPDFNGDAEDSEWEEIEQEAIDLGIKLAETVREVADEIMSARPLLPEGLRGRAKERWTQAFKIHATQWQLTPPEIARISTSPTSPTSPNPARGEVASEESNEYGTSQVDDPGYCSHGMTIGVRCSKCGGHAQHDIEGEKK